MRASDDDGRVLDAEYFVERDGGGLALVLASAGGASGSRPARNTGYRRALAVLLTRLRDLDGVVLDALVDSLATQRRGLAEAQRRLIGSAIRLTDEADMEAVRLRLTSAQARIGQGPDVAKGGNSSKRIRLRLDVPGYGAIDADQLAERLRTAADGPDIGSALVTASGRAGRHSGRIADAIVRAAVEKHAVNQAMAHYGQQGYDVTDVGTRESYDIRAIRGSDELHIEVKGSMMSTDYVELTIAEVEHARRAATDLIVVDQIQSEKLPDGTIQTTGGRFRLWNGWQPAEADLRPSRYQYRLPGQ